LRLFGGGYGGHSFLEERLQVTRAKRDTKRCVASSLNRGTLSRLLLNLRATLGQELQKGFRCNLFSHGVYPPFGLTSGGKTGRRTFVFVMFS
jgi:hypothetical protein